MHLVMTHDVQYVDDTDFLEGGAVASQASNHITLLDPMRRSQYSAFLWQYAEILYAWGLLNQRAAILKFLPIVASLPVNQGLVAAAKELKAGMMQFNWLSVDYHDAEFHSNNCNITTTTIVINLLI
eukprot:jgi/Hompol1/2725/HPOL_003042-RA